MASLKIQSNEIRDLKEIFISLDADQNGYLSVEELRNGFGNICMLELLQDHKHGSDGDDFVEVMKKMDLDSDGKIDYNEFLQATVNHQALINKQSIKQMFDLFDMNSDG